MNIIAYTYNSDIHCPDCARDAAFIHGILRPCGVSGTPRDEHGVPESLRDQDDNPVHPVFSTDENALLAGTVCSDCGAELG